MASDPQAWEKMVLDQSDHKEETKKKQYKQSATPSAVFTVSTNGERKKGYQRPEEWEEEQRRNGNLEWEQKVQFDGQRFGNRVHQNEILNRALKF